MSDFGRRRFLTLAGLCWPERKHKGGCKVLGRGGGEMLPIYRLESRVPGKAFEATFRVTSSRSAGRSAVEALPPLIREIHWRRESDGSTHLHQPTRMFPVLLDATFHFRSDLRRGEMTGFAEFGGLLGPFAGLAGETREERALAEPGVTERAKLRSGLREDGSLATEDDYLKIGGVELWRYRELAVEREASDSVTIDGASWPARRIDMQTPVDPSFRVRARLAVWVSDELSLVLREEAHQGEELWRTFEAVTLQIGAGDP